MGLPFALECLGETVVVEEFLSVVLVVSACLSLSVVGILLLAAVSFSLRF